MQRTIHPMIIIPGAELRAYATHLPDGRDVAPRGIVHFPAPGQSAVAVSALSVGIYNLDLSPMPRPRNPALTEDLTAQIENRRNMFEAEYQQANHLVSQYLRGAPWLNAGFPDANHDLDYLLPHLLTSRYRRRNMTELRPCVGNIRATSALGKQISHLPERDEIQFFLLHSALSQHHIVQAHRLLPIQIETWKQVRKISNPIGDLIFAAAEAG